MSKMQNSIKCNTKKYYNNQLVLLNPSEKDIESMLQCQNCEKTLGSHQGGLFIGSGADYTERLKSKTTFCTECKIALCFQCVYEAAKIAKSGFPHVCPNCKNSVPGTVAWTYENNEEV